MLFEEFLYLMVKNILFPLLFIVAFIGCNKDDEIDIPRTYVPDDNFEQQLIDMGHDNILDNYVLTDNINKIRVLEIFGWERVQDLTGIEDFKMLSTLDCYGQKLISLDLSRNMYLTELNCSFNKLTSLNVSKNIQLRVLLCGDNNLSVLEVNNNINLIELAVYANELTEINLKENKKLEKLFLQDNNLTELDLNENNMLSFFRTTNNPDLKCIQVIDRSFTDVRFMIDPMTTLSDDCGY